MSSSGGGVAAAFGFRYQYAVTVEILLDLYADPVLSSWHVDVDLEGQDSADILVSCHGRTTWDMAVQVKGSQPDAGTTMGSPEVRRILSQLTVEHPTVPDRRLLTNRILTQDLATTLSKGILALPAGERFVQDPRDLMTIAQSLLTRIGSIRQRGAGGIGVHHLILSQLMDLVSQRGSDKTHQRITQAAIEQILAEPAALLADAAHTRAWGRTLGMPQGHALPRPSADAFLNDHLPLSSLDSGAVQCAALTGLSGTGKTAAALRFALQRLENMAVVLWLDASSEASLSTQLPRVLAELGQEDPLITPTPQALLATLSETPVPWLLVLDNAPNPDTIDGWIPRSGYGHVLITSTLPDWPANVAPGLPIGSFTPDEALEFLAARLQAPRAEWTPPQDTACRELAHHLEYWPLALEVAAVWIRRQQGSIHTIHHFVDRISRLDLDDTALVPHGYPTTAYRVVTNLLQTMTAPARAIAAILFAMGGRQIPVTLLDAWMQRRNTSSTARQELLHYGIAQLALRPDSQGSHDYDQTISMHDAVRMVLEKSPTGVGVDPRDLEALIAVCMDQVQNLIHSERFIEAATLVLPIDELLGKIVSSLGPKDVPISCTLLMHNIGILAYIVDGTRPDDPNWTTNVARRWLGIAVTIRNAQLDMNIPAIAALQVETLGQLAVLVHRTKEDDELIAVAQQACQHASHHGAALSQDNPDVPEALRMIREALTYRNLRPDLQHQLETFEILTRTGAQRNTAASALVEQIQAHMQQAIALVDHDQWSEGTTLAVSTAERAIAAGALASSMIEGILDIGIGLLVAVARRPADSTAPRQIISQVVVWLTAHAEILTPSQHARLTLLDAAATGDPSTLASAAHAITHDPVNDTELLRAWTDLAHRIAAQYRGLDRFSQLPPGLIVHNMSDDLRSWEAADSTGRPLLFVHVPGTFTIDSSGRHDHGGQPFRDAGLVEITYPTQPIPAAPDWQARLRDDGLWVYAPDGRALVQSLGLSPEFIESMENAGGMALIYHDPADHPHDKPFTAPMAWITYRSPQPPTRTWWQRLTRRHSQQRDIRPPAGSAYPDGD